MIPKRGNSALFSVIFFHHWHGVISSNSSVACKYNGRIALFCTFMFPFSCEEGVVSRKVASRLDPDGNASTCRLARDLSHN